MGHSGYAALALGAETGAKQKEEGMVVKGINRRQIEGRIISGEEEGEAKEREREPEEIRGGEVDGGGFRM